MRYDNELNQASKITLFSIIVTSSFATLEKVGTLVHDLFALSGKYGTFFSSSKSVLIKARIENFFKVNMLWFVAVLLIILGLCIYIKRNSKKISKSTDGGIEE
jgi:preprotein translocase subunit SecG